MSPLQLTRYAVLVGLAGVSACNQSRAAERATVLVLVSNEDSGDVSLIDSGTFTVVGRVAVGKRPRGLRAASDGKLAYVALSGSAKGGPHVDESTLPPPDRAADGIGVVDLAARRLLRVLPGGADPEAFDLVGGRLFVSNEDTAQASIIRERDGTVETTLSVGAEPEGVTASPDGKFVYVTSEAAGEVDVIDVAERRIVARVPVGSRPRSVAFQPDGSRAYVTNELDASVTVIQAETHQPLQTVRLPPAHGGARPKPMGIVIASNGEHAYVTTGRAQGVLELELRGNTVTRALSDVGARPWGIGLTSDGRHLYVANGPSHDVSVIDVAAWKVIERIQVGRSPWGIATVPSAQP